MLIGERADEFTKLSQRRRQVWGHLVTLGLVLVDAEEPRPERPTPFPPQRIERGVGNRAIEVRCQVLLANERAGLEGGRDAGERLLYGVLGVPNVAEDARRQPNHRRAALVHEESKRSLPVASIHPTLSLLPRPLGLGRARSTVPYGTPRKKMSRREVPRRGVEGGEVARAEGSRRAHRNSKEKLMNRRSIVWGLAVGVVGAVALVGVAGLHRAALADTRDGEGLAISAGEWMGPHGAVGAALEKLDLRADQRGALEQLKTDVMADTASLRAAHDRLLEAVATSLESGGTLDHAAIDPLFAAMQGAVAAHRPVIESAANRFHGILDGRQREQLVSGLHGQVLSRLHHGGADHLATMAARLGLTDDQVATVRERLQAAHEGEPGAGTDDVRAHLTQVRALATAFESDSFDAHALRVGDLMSTMVDKAGRVLGHLDVALAVLTPAQRTELARMLRARVSSSTPPT